MAQMTTRDLIVEVADRLFYENGFEYTSFSDIAAAVKISRGNFYYHFKSKDEILSAVIDRRLENTRNMLERWERDAGSPMECIRRFINILIANRAKIMLYGCPVGTLCSELAKLNHAAQSDANKLFVLFKDWLQRQFTLLGREADADALAMHLLACSQGIATLANAFRDRKFVEREAARMNAWLDASTSENGLSISQEKAR